MVGNRAAGGLGASQVMDGVDRVGVLGMTPGTLATLCYLPVQGHHIFSIFSVHAGVRG